MQRRSTRRIETVCQALIIADTHCHFRAARNRVAHERSLRVGVALSDQRQLDVAIEESRQHFQDGIHHLLMGGATDPDHQGHLRRRSKAELALQFVLATRLANHGIPHWSLPAHAGPPVIPKLVINSVGDAVELRRASAQQTVKTATELRRQDFTRIARAYRREPVAVANARLQK